MATEERDREQEHGSTVLEIVAQPSGEYIVCFPGGRAVLLAAANNPHMVSFGGISFNDCALVDEDRMREMVHRLHDMDRYTLKSTQRKMSFTNIPVDKPKTVLEVVDHFSYVEVDVDFSFPDSEIDVPKVVYDRDGLNYTAEYQVFENPHLRSDGGERDEQLRHLTPRYGEDEGSETPDREMKNLRKILILLGYTTPQGFDENVYGMPTQE